MKTQSDTIGKIVEALSKAQIEFQPIIKGVKAYQHKYAPLDVCYEATRKALHNNGLVVTQSDQMFGERILLETTLGHVSGEYFKSYTDLTKLLNDVEVKNPLHTWGSIKTYTRRYAYLLIVGAIGEDEDNDGVDMRIKPQQEPLTTRLINLIKSSGCDISAFTEYHHISSKDLLTVKHAIDNFDELLIKFKDSKRMNDDEEADI